MNSKKILTDSKRASRALLKIEDSRISAFLKTLAKELEKNSANILRENLKDLKNIDVKNAIYDRVRLDKVKIEGIAKGVREIAEYKSPIGISLEKRTLKNGLKLEKITTPLGTVGVIFEARPNVVVDVFAICFKAKNVCILKGGSDAKHSNEILMKIIKNTLRKFFGRNDFVELLPNERKYTNELMCADGMVDLLIPRGSMALIDFVRKNATVPVIETGAGVCHTYFEESGNVRDSAEIIFNAKTQRPGVCNALDTLIVNEKALKHLPKLCVKLAEKEVEIFADDKSFKKLKGNYPAELLKKSTKESFGTEYLSLKMSIKTVKNIEEAISHINTFGSGHSEAILSFNKKNIERFLNEVDASCVYANASTRFTDGGEFGLGAEIGISTQKLHARGPMGIRELTSYKWQIKGSGQIHK